MRAIVRFGKQARLRFISHLDLQRFFQRALNRTGLPIAYSQGFNPHPLIAFGSALALGWTSEYELIDIKLAFPMGRKRVEDALKQAMPEDLPILEVKLVDDRHSSLMPMVQASGYCIDNSGVDQAALDGFMAKTEVLAIRKTKSGEKEINIRPLVHSISLSGDRIECVLALNEANTLKPDLLVSTLTGSANEDMSIHRRTLLGLDENGELQPLMQLI